MIEHGKKYGMPLVLSYFTLKENVFLNTVHAEAKGLEALGNCALSSYHYLFSGRKFTRIDHTHLFRYTDPLAIEWLKTVAAILTLPISFIIGAALKSLSFLFQENARKHHDEFLENVKKLSLPPIDGAAFLPQET